MRKRQLSNEVPAFLSYSMPVQRQLSYAQQITSSICVFLKEVEAIK